MVFRVAILAWLATALLACSTKVPETPLVVAPQPWTAEQGSPTSIQKWASAMQPRPIVEFFDGLFHRVGVRVSDTGEAFTCVHAGDAIVLSDELDPDSVDFVVTIDSVQVDRMLGYLETGELDEAAKFRIMAVLATPATRAMLARPAIRSESLRSFLYWVGNSPERMQVVLAAPPGETETGHTVVREGPNVRVVAGLQGEASVRYRLTVADAVDFQRRMLAARRTNAFWTWIDFARWYGAFTARVAVPVEAAAS